ncbi:MAG: transglycosylase SLT domain-containing protein [Candidatus Tectomicrobia bacterium]|nr:transglycosylase SLT domain-containing protein [Candidatus Tectomicrobia bacterium]
MQYKCSMKEVVLIAVLALPFAFVGVGPDLFMWTPATSELHNELVSQIGHHDARVLLPPKATTIRPKTVAFDEDKLQSPPAEITVTHELSAAPSPDTVDLRALLASTRSADVAAASYVEQLLDQVNGPMKSSPMWPLHTFLLGEVHRLRGDIAKAMEAYRALAEWAATDPYGDGWGGSGLSSVALWRWLQIAHTDTSPGSDEVTHLLEVAEKLRGTRLMRRMFDTPVLSTLPQLEEETVRRLALLAWAVGKQDKGQRLFLEYLALASTAELGSSESKLLDQLLASGLASPERLVLLRGKRFQSLGRYDEAYRLLSKARQSQSVQIRPEAGLYLAEIQQIRGGARTDIAALLSSVLEEATDPDIIQEALFTRALRSYREGPGRNVQQFLKDLTQLVKDFPRGRLADDALYLLALHHFQQAGDIDRALHYFEQLQNFQGPNDWVNSALFFPAIVLYTRGKPEDLTKARTFLQKLETQQPFGPLHLNSLFWLGRIAAGTDNAEEAERYFQQVIAESPYDYYAIRARMHLHLGNRASKELWPDPETRDELHAAYQVSRIDHTLTGNSPYHLRLKECLESGLYAMVLATELSLREIFPSQRLENLSVEQLDEAGMLAHVSLLLALRQDALAAKDALPTPENRLQIASGVGHVAGDWPLAMSLINASEEPFEQRVTAQRDEHYLATAYPIVFERSIKQSSTARNVRPALLYGVMRQESLFYPAALSPRGALGLFQFIPATFQELNRRWKLLETSGISSREAFLLDPELSIDLGARWFKDELLSRQRNNVLLALMEHHAGYPAVREWIAYWRRLGRDNDLEYMIETIRIVTTGIFIRRVLSDMAIVEASGILDRDK